MPEKMIKIGMVGVDSGLIAVCDPCYINHKGEHKELNDYHGSILKKVNGNCHAQLNYDKGRAGLGVVCGCFGGDGTYPVYAKIVDDIVKEIIIKFDEGEK